MLEIRELRKTYPAQGGHGAALDGVGFTVEAGIFVSVIGPSGAGKSTLLRCVTGQLRPDGGSVLLDGTDMVPLRGRHKRRLQREQGLSVLMNSHNVDQALRYSDRILGLRQGRVVFDGPPAAVTEAVLKDIYGGEAAHEAD